MMTYEEKNKNPLSLGTTGFIRFEAERFNFKDAISVLSH